MRCRALASIEASSGPSSTPCEGGPFARAEPASAAAHALPPPIGERVFFIRGHVVARLTIDNIEGDPDALSDAGKAQLKRLEEVVRRIAALQKELAMLEEARSALAQSLKRVG